MNITDVFTFPSGCHVAEVEIDPETGTLEVVRYTAVDDAGTIVNHQIVEGQMQGGITQHPAGQTVPGGTGQPAVLRVGGQSLR